MERPVGDEAYGAPATATAPAGTGTTDPGTDITPATATDRGTDTTPATATADTASPATDTASPAIDTGPAGIAAPPVSAWLVDHVPGATPPFTFDLIAGGHSNLTYRVTDAQGHRVVLRRPPLGALASAHDMGREHGIISALADTLVPVPPAVGYCDDPAVTGAPFYVMGYVDGLVLRSRADAEAHLSVAARRDASDAMVDTLAALHAVDPDAVGLGDLGPRDGYIGRQLKRWYGQWQAQRTHDIPEVEHVHGRLSERIPAQRSATIIHGDYRLDNCMVTPEGQLGAVLDWEICTLGDPLADVGFFLVYWSGPDDEPSAWSGAVTGLDGFRSRRELLDRYAHVSGRQIADIDFYIAFAFWKLACISSTYSYFGDRVEAAARHAAAALDRTG